MREVKRRTVRSPKFDVDAAIEIEPLEGDPPSIKIRARVAGQISEHVHTIGPSDAPAEPGRGLEGLQEEVDAVAKRLADAAAFKAAAAGWLDQLK